MISHVYIFIFLYSGISARTFIATDYVRHRLKTKQWATKATQATWGQACLCWLPEPTQIAINDLNLDQLDETLLEMWDSQIPTAQKK